MRDARLDFLATLFDLARAEFAPGDYEEDADLARRIQVAARHGPSRQSIATMAISAEDAAAEEGQRVSLRPEAANNSPTALNTLSDPARNELACVFCHRPGRVRVEGFAPECDDCASSWEEEPGRARQEGRS